METQLRQIAKTQYWQNIYKHFKEGSPIQLFKNNYDFSSIQIRFLYWLEIYNSLYYDLYTKEKYISDDVLKDDFRVDCYLLYKYTEKKKEDDKKFEGKKSDKQYNPCIEFRKPRNKKVSHG